MDVVNDVVGIRWSTTSLTNSDFKISTTAITGPILTKIMLILSRIREVVKLGLPTCACADVATLYVNVYSQPIIT